MTSMATPLLAMALLAAAPKVDFVREVRPILSDRCFACHGPDEANRKANLRLDTAEGAKAAIDSGKLLGRVTHAKKAQRMPPPGAPELSEAQIAALKNWVDSGAEYKMHWSYVAPRRPDLPAVKNSAWSKNEIDRFILARLEKEGLSPSPRATVSALLRRVTFDLTGLPPTVAELDAFLRDPSPKAYEKAVDRLLASPRYGERMAMPWLDISRYADTHGYHIDSHRDMWPWRDWVISAFNRNLPYDQFLTWQLAGDLMPNPTREQTIATGFNRNHMINYEGGAIPEEYLVEYLVDRVEATSTAFLGTTMGCARCHDHKYDPIRQSDFYRFFAFFNAVPEKGLDGQKGNAWPALRLPDAAQNEAVTRVESRIAQLESWMDDADIDAQRGNWESQALLPPSPPAALGGPAVSIRIRMSARLDTKPSMFLDGPVKMWIDGGVAIGRNRRGSRICAAAEGQILCSRDRFVTGDWMHIALNNGELWVDAKPAEWEEAPGEAIPDATFKGSKEPVRYFARELTPDEIRILAFVEPAREALEVPSEKRNRDQRFAILDYYLTSAAPDSVRAVNRELQSLYKQREELEWEIPSTMVMGDMPIPRETKILARGDYRNGTTPVAPGVPAFLPPMPSGAPGNRLGLAQWMTSPDNPLVARVAVNRIWQILFGQGLTKTVEDFGSQGEFPVHPELLDWLATDFVAQGWDSKAIVKKMVMSETYRQSSKVTPALLDRDPENRLLARGPRYRLPAEMIRDNALAVSGLMNTKIGGPSVYPYQPKGVWEDIAYGDTFSSQNYVPDRGDKLYRRSMYTFWKRTAPPPTLATFDAPDREKCSARRLMTNTPLQALVLLNDPTFVESARQLAWKASSAPDPVAFMYRTVLARRPTAIEASLLNAQYARQMALYRNHPEGAIQLLSVGESRVPSNVDKAKLAAWTTIASVILNLDEAIAKE